MLRHWSQFVPNMSTDFRGHEALLHHQLLPLSLSLPLPASHITPSISFRHLPLWGKDVVNQCLEVGITHHRSWLKGCFTSTETIGLLGTGAQDGVVNHCLEFGITSQKLVEGLLYVHRNRRFIRDGSPGRHPPRLSHSS